MKVYRFENDINHFQSFLPAADEEDGSIFTTECIPLAETWKPPEVYIDMPKLKAGDLYNTQGCSPIFRPSAMKKLQEYLEMAGELLPLPYKSEVYTLLNVTECIDCLDRKNTEWLYAEDAWPIKQYAFHKSRFSESRIFKIPETCKAEVLILDLEDGEGFIEALQEHGIVGYELTLLWEG